MIYPLMFFSTVLGRFKKCPNCGKLQAVSRKDARPVCRKCGRIIASLSLKRPSSK